MTENYLKVIETLGSAIISKDLEISVLKYENESLKAKIETIEEYVNFYEKSCEVVNE